MIKPGTTLVKYDNPRILSSSKDKKPKDGSTKRTSTTTQNGAATTKLAAVEARPKARADIGGISGPGKPLGATANTEEILNAISPPKEWIAEGQTWIQQISSTPATRVDVLSSQEQLDKMLSQRHARATGICPIRRELYSQCFNELIRQVTIECSERGQLLLRVRDEIQMTMQAYQTLYESAIAFGMRKALEAEQGLVGTEQKIKEYEEEKKELERMVAELKAKVEMIEKREQERREQEERAHNEEVNFLKKTNQQLRVQLESLLKK